MRVLKYISDIDTSVVDAYLFAEKAWFESCSVSLMERMKSAGVPRVKIG